jgi:glycosyltransferase involved in cell wall biosynthesis
MRNNILQITGFPEGGIGTHLITICEKLQNKYNISIATNFERQDLRFKEAYTEMKNNFSCITDLRIEKNPSYKDVLNILKLYKIYKDRDIDVIHGHGAKGGLYARILGLLLKSKVAYTPHGGSLHDMHGSTMGVLYIIIEKLLYYFTDKFIFESEYSLNAFLNKVNKNRSKLEVNHNGIKINRVINEKELDKKDVQLSAFGLLRFLKGHDILIKSISCLIEQGYRVHLTIYGDGKEKNNLEKIILNLNLQNYVTLAGFVNNPEECMIKSDIVVQPSRFESFGYVPIEAMNLNRPVIVSDVGGLLEIVEDMHNGLVFKGECVDCLVNKLKLIIDNSLLRSGLVANAKNTISSKFTDRIMINRLDCLYKELLG